MERLTNPTYMRAVLDRYGFTFKKKFGQNFLTNDQVLDDICDAAEITRNRFMPNLIVKNITIGTEVIQSEDGKAVNVSSMEILLAKD